MTRLPSHAEMLAALEDPNERNPLAMQIAAAITAYGEMLNEQARRAGAVPDPFVMPIPKTEVEAFAAAMFTREITKMGVRVIIDVPLPREPKP